MGLLYLIRHARPAAGWGEDADPGLDDLGHAQARKACDRLLGLPSPPLRVVSSPLRRCRETASPLAAALGLTMDIEPAVGEIPTPAALPTADRPQWLRQAMTGAWSQIVGDLDYEAWRQAMITVLAGYSGAAVFSHFVAINAVVSALTGEERVVVFRPDHASITTLAIEPGGLRLVERGPEAATGVL